MSDQVIVKWLINECRYTSEEKGVLSRFDLTTSKSSAEIKPEFLGTKRGMTGEMNGGVQPAAPTEITQNQRI